MNIMESRYDALKATVQGLIDTDVPLVAARASDYSAAGHGDDVGIYYFIPLVAKSTGLPLNVAVNLFFGSILALSFIVGAIAFFTMFRDLQTRILIAVGLCLLLLLAIYEWDVYVIPAAIVVGIGPLALLILFRKKVSTRAFMVTVTAAGLLIGYANHIRTHAGTGMLIFLAISIALTPLISTKQKMVAGALLLLALTLPYAHFHALQQARDNFLATHTDVAKDNATRAAHPVWHSIYIGLGFLNNKYGIRYDDAVALAAVAAEKPDAAPYFVEYENVLKRKVMGLISSDPSFVAKTLFIKSLVLLGYFVLFSGFGVFLYGYARPEPAITLAFLAAAAFYALPGLLVVPRLSYSMGMLSIACVLGIYLVALTRERLSEQMPGNQSSVLDARPM